MRIDILSLFPGYFKGPFDESILKRAQENQLLDIHLLDIRQFATSRFKQVDDRPYGGGPGMVLMPEPVQDAIRSVKGKDSRVIYLSPQGARLTAEKCQQLAALPHLVLLCGHYEGIDQRVIDLEVDEEISIGDYVLTNGCLASIVLVDALVRFIPGVLGDARAALEDSFTASGGLLDHPHYTRPPEFAGVKVPEVLLQGNHEEILRWRGQKALAKTRNNRPDLWRRFSGFEEDPSPVEAAPGKVSLKRIALPVRNLKRTRRFLKEMFGFKPAEQSEFKALYHLDGISLAFIQDADREAPIEPDFVFHLAADSESQFQRLVHRWSKQAPVTWEQEAALIKDLDGYEWRCYAL
ncbi:MAG: trmD [Chlamydiales bacterium]|nr:trmD [Chlamydiales bacterium]